MSHGGDTCRSATSTTNATFPGPEMVCPNCASLTLSPCQWRATSRFETCYSQATGREQDRVTIRCVSSALTITVCRRSVEQEKLRDPSHSYYTRPRPRLVCSDFGQLTLAQSQNQG